MQLVIKELKRPTGFKMKNQFIFWIATFVFSILAQGSLTDKFPKSCSEIQLEQGSNSTGLQKQVIFPNGTDGASLEVLCDFEIDGGGWTIIQKRSSGPQQEFSRIWTEYANGFGSLDGNFWLGLDNIHALTKNGDQELRIELENFAGSKRWAKYSNFSISDASDFYRLAISGFDEDSTVGDSMTNSEYGDDYILNDMRFSARDKDNDLWSTGDCAGLYGEGGWWFNRCGDSNLNGLYYEQWEVVPAYSGIYWYFWTAEFYSLAKTEMKIRPRK